MTQATTQNINTASKIPAYAPIETEPTLTPHEGKIVSKLIARGQSAGAYALLNALREESVSAITTIYRALKGLQHKRGAQHLVSTKTYVVIETTQKIRAPKLLLICDQCPQGTWLEEGGMLNKLAATVRQTGFAVQAEHLKRIVSRLKCSEQGAAS